MKNKIRKPLKTLNEEGIKFFMILGIAFATILFVFFGGFVALGFQDLSKGLWVGSCAAVFIFCQKTYEGYRNEYDI